MLAIEKIREKIEKEVFDYTQLMNVLIDYSKPRDAITSLIKSGQILRLRKGLYLFGKLWRREVISREMLANLIYGPSIISLDYALAFYGLIPERIEVVTSITNGRSRSFKTKIGDFSYTQMKSSRITFGNTLQKNGDSNYLITTPLKALLDKTWCDKRFKPTSIASYSHYIINDLRVEIDLLRGLVTYDQLADYKQKYNSRKIDWLFSYLLKELKNNNG